MLLSEDDEKLLPLDPPTDDEYRGPGERRHEDFIWANLQPFLAKAGYKLRPRFHPKWKPSWLRGGSLAGKDYSDCEDHMGLRGLWAALDAIRVKDSQKVVLKIVYNHTDEERVASFFSLDSRRNDPMNHCVPILEILTVPEKQFKILVMPFLLRCLYPRMHCMSEVVDFIRQTLHGLEFIHEHNIAHRDIGRLNIMMDGPNIAPSGSHFSYGTRNTLKSGLLVSSKTQHRCLAAPVRYYYIDFGFSRHYPEGREEARETGIVGQADVTPELSDDVPYNPFKVDIVQLGAMFQKMFPLEYFGLHDFDPLFDKMTETLPENRPTAADALLFFEVIVSSMSSIRLEALLHDADWRPPQPKRQTRFRPFAPRDLPSIARFLFPSKPAPSIALLDS
ncbi:kinase-like domain-containing protein [Mycena floridula]|nr:kinase-like domain-containing protein [Mycena floridula]